MKLITIAVFTALLIGSASAVIPYSQMLDTGDQNWEEHRFSVALMAMAIGPGNGFLQKAHSVHSLPELEALKQKLLADEQTAFEAFLAAKIAKYRAFNDRRIVELGAWADSYRKAPWIAFAQRQV